MEPYLKLFSIIDASIYNTTGLILVVLGVLVSIRFLGYPDLTVDGSFTLGAALYALGIQLNIPALITLPFAFIGGALSGLSTALINQKLKIGKIISSVLIMLFLITAVPYIVGGSSIGLLDNNNWISKLQNWDINITKRLLGNEVPFSLHIGFCFVFLAFGILITLLVAYFFKASTGVQMRYIGGATNPWLLKESLRKYLLFGGLALGNGLIALGGAIEAQRKGGYNQNMGIGTILIALTVLVLGESIMKTRLRRDNLYINEYIKAILIGVFIYSFGLQLVLSLKISFLDVKLTTTIFLLILLAFAARKHPNSGRLF